MGIREAGPADVAGIVALIGAVATENRWVRTEIPFDTAERERRMSARMATGEVLAFVADLDGALAGELSLRVRGERAVFGMVVARGQRRRGFGRELVAAALAAARERSVRCIEIEVYAHNSAAIKLYGAMGFVEHGERGAEQRLDGRDWTVVRMRNELL